MYLQLHILAQAIEDVLRFELGLPLVGVPERLQEQYYEDSLAFMARYPSLVKRWQRANKRAWLQEVEDARG